MKLGTIADLQAALGGGSKGYCCALKRAAGVNGSRLFDVDAVVQWRTQHPEFKITDIYPRIVSSRDPKISFRCSEHGQQPLEMVTSPKPRIILACGCQWAVRPSGEPKYEGNSRATEEGGRV